MRRGFLNNKNAKKGGIFYRERKEGTLPADTIELKLSYGKIENNGEWLTTYRAAYMNEKPRFYVQTRRYPSRLYTTEP